MGRLDSWCVWVGVGDGQRGILVPLGLEGGRRGHEQRVTQNMLIFVSPTRLTRYSEIMLQYIACVPPSPSFLFLGYQCGHASHPQHYSA